jgi:cold shock CspA family protein
MADSFNKKEKQKRKVQKKKEKAARKEARKAEEKGSGLDAMMAYVDENGVLQDTPPDLTKKKVEIKAENIEIGVPKKEDLPEEDPIHEGKVTFFNDEKGYGFIKDKISQDSFFVHMNNCQEPIGEGDKVQFELEPGQKGMAAVKVKKI